RLRRPLDVEPLVRVAARLRGGRAVVGVDDQALSLLDEADDGIARDRVAAARELDRESLGPMYDDRPSGGFVLGLVAFGEGQQLPRDDRGEPLAEADVGEHFLPRFPPRA